MGFNKRPSYTKTANKLVERLDQFDKLREIANRKNYPYKVKKLHEKISEEHSLWSKKEPSAKLADLQKDLTFILLQIDNSNLNKDRIDLLMEKYGYGKSSTGSSY